jgi:O-antigen/teichoic acid export membrane protein
MKPGSILVPNGWVNPEIPDLNAAYAAAAWDIPVFDLNSEGRTSPPPAEAGAAHIALSVRSFARAPAAELRAALALRPGPPLISSLRGPVDVLCCYRYLADPPLVDPGLAFDDTLPFPAFERFANIANLAGSWRTGRTPYPLLTSLGCPYGCRFCAAAGRRWRPLSPERCAAELRAAQARWGVSTFQILDDCFNRDHERLLAFCEQVAPLGLTWFCNNGLRADALLPGQARALYEAGCRHVSFGVEAADDTVLRRIGKGETLAQIEAAVAQCHEAGLTVAGFFLIGLPGASRASDLAGLAWAKTQRVTPHFSYYVPPAARDEGDSRFWGAGARPRSDAYPATEQADVYALSRPPSGLGRRLVHNTLFNLAGRGAGTLLALLLTPYVVARLGPERFGIWSLVALVTGYVGLLDFGLRESFVKHIAEFHAQGERHRLEQLLNTACFFFLLWTLPVVTLGLWAAGRLPALLAVPHGLHGDAAFVFAGAVLLLAGQNLFVVFEALPAGLQRMGLANLFNLAFALLTAAGTLAVLAAGWGLRGLVLSGLVVTGLRGVAAALVATRLQAGLTLSWRRVDLRLLGTLSRFGVQRWIAQLEELATFQTDKLIIANVSGLSFVGLYQLGFALVDKASLLPRLLGSAVVPAAAELAARRSPEQLTRLYREGTRYVVLLAAPLFAFLLVSAPVVLAAWMGPGFADTVPVVRLFAAAFFLMSLTTVNSALAVGIGRPGFQMVIGGVQAIVNVALSVFLARRIGFLGPVIASVLCLGGSAVALTLCVNRHLRLAWHEGLRPALMPALLAAGAALATWLLQRDTLALVGGRGSALGLLAAEALVFGLLYTAGAWLAGLVRPEDVATARACLGLAPAAANAREP